MELAREVERIARRKGCSISQIALAWVIHHSGRSGFPEIVTIPGATTSSRVEENMKSVTLSDAEFEELNNATRRFEIVGTRYP